MCFSPSLLADLFTQRTTAEAEIRKASQNAIVLIQRLEAEHVEELSHKYESAKGCVMTSAMTLDQQIQTCDQLLDVEDEKIARAADSEVIRNRSSIFSQDAFKFDTKHFNALLSRLKNVRLEFMPAELLTVNLGEVVINLHRPSISTEDSCPKPVLPVKPRPRSKTMGAAETTGASLCTSVILKTISGKFREDQVLPKLRDILVMRLDKVVLATDWANQCVKVILSLRGFLDLFYQNIYSQSNNLFDRKQS